MFAAKFMRQAARPMVRTMATAKASSAPVQLFGLDGSYATALYSAASKSSTLPSTESALSALKDLVKNDAKLPVILENPALSTEDKKTVISTLSSAIKADSTVSNFLSLLAENNRLSLIPSIVEKFETLTNAANGVVEATITSASPLDNKTTNRLSASISKSSFVGEGKTLKVTNRVNADILGGLVVEVGDRTVDLSIANKIVKLNKALTDDI
ncbi:hypothetical protein DS838_000062 [Geotrichum bryndzae]|nr:hypothetical protein DS838_000062 [Geotrichum bryndzae]